MSHSPSIPAEASRTDSPETRRSRLAAAVLQATVGTRSRRVCCLLAVLWLLNGFDLIYTILANQIGHFPELNPVARPLLDNVWALSAFKAGAVALGSIILFVLRKHRITEFVTWSLVLVYTALAFRWMRYYAMLH